MPAPAPGAGRSRSQDFVNLSRFTLAAMRNLVIPALVLLPTLATIAHAAQERRPYDAELRRQQEQALTPRERSVTYSGCREIRDRGLAPLRRGQPGYRPWMDGDNDGFACEPIRR